MSIFDFLIIALACWRITSLFVREDGPGGIFAKFRNWLGVRYNTYSMPYGTNGFSKAILCIWCSSVWTGLFFAILYIIGGEIFLWFCVPFSFSAVAILINEVIDKLQQN